MVTQPQMQGVPSPAGAIPKGTPPPPPQVQQVVYPAAATPPAPPAVAPINPMVPAIERLISVIDEKDKDKAVQPFYKFSGKEGDMHVKEWFKKIEDRFTDTWDDQQKLNFATRHLDASNPELRPLTQRVLSSYAHLKRQLLITFGSQCKPFSLSEWIRSKRW